VFPQKKESHIILCSTGQKASHSGSFQFCVNSSFKQ